LLAFSCLPSLACLSLLASRLHVPPSHAPPSHVCPFSLAPLATHPSLHTLPPQVVEYTCK
jgi:hypothetical protein